MDLSTYYSVVFYVMAGVFGLCIGSFLNVVIYRVPLGMSVAKPASHCTCCGYELKWYDNIPVVSYIMLGGKCRKCKSHISFRYTLVEIGTAVLFLLAAFKFGCGSYRSIILFLASAVALACSVCVFFIDLEHKLIFDRFQIIILVCAIVYTVFDKSASPLVHIIGAFVGGISFYLIGYLVSKAVGREALGGGDVKFAFCSGLFVGCFGFIIMALTASLSALIVILILKNKKDGEAEFAFGPFLTVGFAVSMLYADVIIKTYLNLIGLE